MCISIYVYGKTYIDLNLGRTNVIMRRGPLVHGHFSAA